MSASKLLLVSMAAALVAAVPIKAEDAAATVTLPTRLDPATGQTFA